MNCEAIEKIANSLLEEAPFIAEIKTPLEHKQACDFFNYLVDDYTRTAPLTDLIARNILRYESQLAEPVVAETE